MNRVAVLAGLLMSLLLIFPLVSACELASSGESGLGELDPFTGAPSPEDGGPSDAYIDRALDSYYEAQMRQEKELENQNEAYMDGIQDHLYEHGY